MNTIFDITGDRFFVPLASRNRKLYIDTILYLHQLINDLFESEDNNKTIIIEKLAEHLDDLVSINIYDEESSEFIEGLDNTAKASLLINKLEDYGWLTEEAIGDGKRALDFNSYSYDFINLIEEMIQNRKPQYTSYIKIINNSIYNFDYSKRDDLEIIDDSLNKFVVSLRQLRSDIQRYYKNITKNKEDIDLIALLNQFTGEYKDYFFDSAYLNLKMRDNVDTEIPRISEQLDMIFSDDIQMEKLIRASVDKDRNYEEAVKYVQEIKRRIKTNIRTIPSIIEMIDSKNQKYVTRTVSVLIHLINRGEDIEGILHRLIDYVKESDTVESFISIFEMKHYTFDALSKPRKINPRPKPEMISMDLDVSDEVINQTLELFKEDKKYNVFAVNSFVKDFLRGYKKRNISDLNFDSKYEFIMMICIIVYSKLPNVIYDIELLDNKIKKNNTCFSDFIIMEKE